MLKIQGVPAKGIKNEIIFSESLKFFLSYFFLVKTKVNKAKIVSIQFDYHIPLATPIKLPFN